MVLHLQLVIMIMTMTMTILYLTIPIQIIKYTIYEINLITNGSGHYY